MIPSSGLNASQEGSKEEYEEKVSLFLQFELVALFSSFSPIMQKFYGTAGGPRGSLGAGDFLVMLLDAVWYFETHNSMSMHFQVCCGVIIRACAIFSEVEFI